MCWPGVEFGILCCAPRCYDDERPCDLETASSKNCAGSGGAHLAEEGVDTTLPGGGRAIRPVAARMYSQVSSIMNL